MEVWLLLRDAWEVKFEMVAICLPLVRNTVTLVML